MQPQQNYMYGGVQSPYANERFQGAPFGYVQRTRMPLQGQMYRASVPGGPPPLMGGNLQQQQHHSHSGMGRMSGVLPSLQSPQMVGVNRGGGGGGGGMPTSAGSSGLAGQMPMPPTSPSGTYMRRPPVQVRPQQMGGYLGKCPRGMTMNGAPMFPNNLNCHSPHNLMLGERQNSGGLPGNRANIQMKQQASAAVAGGRSRGISFPLLRGVVDPHSKYPMPLPPPHMMPHHFTNSALPYSEESGSSNSSNPKNSCALAASNGVSEDFNSGDIFTVEMDEEGLERTMGKGAMPSEARLEDAQNGCNVNTPPLAASDDEGGLTPTPPTLRYLSSYEEMEVKEYIPNVYFGGRDQCKKIDAVRGADNNDGFDDENFHYRVVVGDHLMYRYEVLKVLGQGTFGIVVRAMDHKLHTAVAIKIIKNKPNYTKQAQEEIKTLELLNSDDLNNEANIVRLIESCVFRHHYLLVFELLPSDLYALIQANKFRPMSRDFIYELSEQLLTALVHIRRHRIVHCDLKPENIMISESAASASSSEPAEFALKLIDFGSACEESRPLFTYIQSRYYRAPEIVLGIPYTTAIDMWSFGCVLCELANGYPIFPASCEGELLERIVEYFGPIPSFLVRQGRRSERFFEGDTMRYNLGRKRAPHPPNSRSLHNFLKVGHSVEDRLFEDFVACCLNLDARQRLTPEAALEHPWLDQWRYCSTGSELSDVSSSSGLGN